jgi:hypothetical protein
MCFRLPLLAFMFGSAALSILGQNSVRIDASRVFLPTPVPGHHIDEFSVYSPLGIKTLDATVLINPMHQINPDGQATVFSDGLSSSELLSDSHFVFDISSATVLLQFEDTTQIRARVEFNANFPTSFTLAQIVAGDGHSDYVAGVTGTLVDGKSFSAAIAFAPEPSVMALGVLGAVGCCLWRARSGAAGACSRSPVRGAERASAPVCKG